MLKRNLKRFYWAIFLMIGTLAGAPKLKTQPVNECVYNVDVDIDVDGCVPFEFIKSPHYWITTQFGRTIALLTGIVVDE